MRNFSRMDKGEFQKINVQEAIDNTLIILGGRLKANPKSPAIKVIKEYQDLPLIDFYPNQLNQVLINIMSNAIDAIDEYSQQRTTKDIENEDSRIIIHTGIIKQANTETITSDWVQIRISDNGPGISPELQKKAF